MKRSVAVWRSSELVSPLYSLEEERDDESVMTEGVEEGSSTFPAACGSSTMDAIRNCGSNDTSNAVSTCNVTNSPTRSSFDQYRQELNPRGAVKEGNQEKREKLAPKHSFLSFTSILAQLLRKKVQKASSVFFFTCSDKEALKRGMNLDFTESLVKVTQLRKSAVDAHLEAALDLVLQLDDILQAKTLLIPDEAHEGLLDLLELFIYPRISYLYLGESIDNFHEVTPQDAAKIVGWIEGFLFRVAQVPVTLSVRAEWRHDCDRLVENYMERVVRHDMKEGLNRALESQDAAVVRTDGDFHMVTGLPELVSYMVMKQISLAQEILPQKYLEQVLSVCNEELAWLVHKMQLNIGLASKDISSSFYCAIINDSSRLAEQCKVRNKQYLILPDLHEKGNNLVKDWTKLLSNATNSLCQCIILELCAPRNHILTSVGDLAWQGDENSTAVQRTIAILKDCFMNLEEWLISDYHFLKILKNCFDLVVQIYLESFFENTMARGVRSAKATAEKLGKDCLRLVVFYNGSSLEKYHAAGGIHSQQHINEELGILYNLAAIISPENPPELLCDDICAIMKRFPEGQGTAAVLHLAGLRKRHGGSESLLWVKVIATVKRDMAMAPGLCLAVRNEDNDVMCKLPNVCKSKYIHNIRPVRQSLLRRCMSEGTMPHAESALQLLETENPFLRTAKFFMLVPAMQEKAAAVK